MKAWSACTGTIDSVQGRGFSLSRPLSLPWPDTVTPTTLSEQRAGHRGDHADADVDRQQHHRG
jgi:hypothetical protein